MIKIGHLSEYTKEDKRDMKASSKSKSSIKMVDTVNIRKKSSSEEEQAHNGKHQYILFIIGGAPQASAPSKGAMKRKIS